jgi:hypothetical protein
MDEFDEYRNDEFEDEFDDEFDEIVNDDFVPEVTAVSRVGFGRPEDQVTELIDPTTGQPVKSTLQEVQGMTPLQRFQFFVRAIALSYIDERTATPELSYEVVPFLVDSAVGLKNVQHKNPTAYVLGYAVRDVNKQINRQRLEKYQKNILSKMPTNPVKREDIIRYARLWNTHL